jgi:DNA polymerase-3 subunit beta
MKFMIKKSDVLDVLSKVQGLAGRKSNLAITSNILVSATEEGVTLAVTDLETGFEGLYPAVVESNGTIAINGRKFFEIVRDFPNEDILVNEVENHWIEISNKNVEYHIVGMNPDDFPSIPAIDSQGLFEIESSALKKMIEKSLTISASDDKRAHITGVYLEKIESDEENLLRMVSTDGSRLSKTDYLSEEIGNLALDASVIIPKKGLSEVNKFLDDEDTVGIGIRESHLIIKKNSENIIIRLLEGEFPKYADIIKIRGGHSVRLNNSEFQMMLKRMSILSSENYKGVIFKFSKGKLVITSTNPDIGESKEEMEIGYEGESMEMAFNPRFFIDTINVLDSESIVINLIDEEKPCIIEGEDEQRFVSVIMPMRI